MSAPLELIVEPGEDGRVRLLSPAVGRFTCPIAKHGLVSGGQGAGMLLCLGVEHALVVPPGVAGRVTNAAPRLVRAPVGYRAVLYELAPIGEAPAADAGVAPAHEGELVFRAPLSGRFWHRAAPDRPPFVSAGDALGAGQPIGILEVMKTFSHVSYRATGPLPERARVVRVLAGDGAEVEEGEPLVEVEPA